MHGGSNMCVANCNNISETKTNEIIFQHILFANNFKDKKHHHSGKELPKTIVHKPFQRK